MAFSVELSSFSFRHRGCHGQVEMGNEPVPGPLQLAGLASCLLLQRSEANVILDTWAGDLGLLLELRVGGSSEDYSWRWPRGGDFDFLAGA